MDNPAGMLDPYGFIASLTLHGVKYDNKPGHYMRSACPITRPPKGGYCVGYRHLFPLNPDNFICPVKVSGGVIPMIYSDFPVSHGSNIIN
jgi:hypothetical protein